MRASLASGAAAGANPPGEGSVRAISAPKGLIKEETAAVRLPTACDAQNQSAYAYVNVLIDGEFVGSGYVGFYPDGPRTQRVGIYFYPVAALMAPDSDSTHLVTARVSDSCAGADQNFTFTSFRLDIVGAS